MTKKVDKEKEAGPVEAEAPEPLTCAGPACGHEITSYPCPYCGFNNA